MYRGQATAQGTQKLCSEHLQMEPVLRVSNDNGKTFGEKIILS
jgi:hypothetical protein